MQRGHAAAAVTVGPVNNLRGSLCARLDVCHMFGDMSPLCNGPAAIYHSLSSLKGRLDLDEHKEYEDDLV